MTLAGGWPYFVLLLALVSAGCQSEDTSAKPPFVSVGYGLGQLTAVPLATPAETVAAETSRLKLSRLNQLLKKKTTNTSSSSAPAMP